MERIANASQFNWKSNTQGRWTAVVDDIAPSTQDISFGNGYTATVTNRKITVDNPTRPSGTVTYAVEDVANTAYVGNLAAVGTVKDTLDVVTGERNVKIGSYTFTGNESWLAYGNTNQYCTTQGVSDAKFAVGALCVSDGLDCIAAADPTDLPEGKCMLSRTDTLKRFYIRDTSLTSQEDCQAYTVGKTIYYELAESSSVEDAPQHLSLSTGANTASMTDTSTGDKPVFPMSYDGTDYAIAAKSTRVYLKNVDGTVERVTGVTSIPVRGGRDNVMDLTRMFGSGLEPGTLDAFYSLFPAWRGYKLPYNEGSLLNFKGTGLKSVGFNQFSGEYSETGKYVEENGSYHTDAALNTTEYIRVIPGQVYRLTTYGNLPAICWYTYDKTYISGTKYGHAGIWQEDVFTAPSNAYWCRFSVYMPKESETCFYFQWSGTRNGDYEPYWDYTRPVPTLTYFPDGMNGRGNVYDEINDRQAIRRFGVVDLGTLTWALSGGYWYNGTLSNSIKKTTANSQVPALISSLYATGSVNDVVLTAGTISVGTNGSICVKNGSTTETPAGWLVYELATPVVTTFSEEISTTARISDFGTEECLPINSYEPVTVPFRGIVLYQDDYARTITKLPENYQSQASMDNLLALLGQLHNGTISTAFDAASQSYKYNFTPNA